MLHALLILLAFQFTGELIVRIAALPVPGAVLGLVLMFIALFRLAGVPEPLQAGGDWSIIKSMLDETLVAAGLSVTIYTLPNDAPPKVAQGSLPLHG